MRKRLIDRLEEMPFRSREEYLKKIWSEFQGSEAHEALVMVMQDIYEAALTDITEPKTPPDERTHAAGRIAGVNLVLSGIRSRLSQEVPEPVVVDAAQGDEDLGPVTDFIPVEEPVI